ncbi:type II secretion system minor pseudopilin GspK [Simiduia agarivorans]|uniref:General secretion pathway protein K n=1 Tax=Simiduia agarivorans (strain DSM 21679 / JCM 13881 / BCRC 17597 / SA1) TaxID=1117647 RepID=R9S515_SIMAS|nr:type II secretion system minor pseudopilin GspK [Simiduia agarivorans]AGN11330.1 general secretion pathway protein K [Simiduia agarivorans SA1 = DSM 21679]
MKPSRQQGAVLIMALLIVALVATLAVSYAGDMLLMQARAENRVLGAQQNAYMDGAIALASFVLEDDAKNGQVDHADEDWTNGQMFPIEGGVLYGTLEDAQSKINLNGLSKQLNSNSNPNDPNRFDVRQRRFLRFLQTFDGSQVKNPPPDTQPLVIDQNLAIAITEAVVDWLDDDDNASGFGGAESLQYQQEGVTWVPPNGEMQSLEELKLIRHITPEIYEAIKPYLVVLPSNADLNINTLEFEKHGPIIQALNQENSIVPLALQDVQGFDGWRTGMPDGYFSSGADLANQPDMNALLSGGTMNPDGLAISTAYFWLNVEVELGNRTSNRRILLNRDQGTIKVLAQYSSGQATSIQALASQTRPDEDSDSAEDKNDDNRRSVPDEGRDNSEQKRR